MPEKQYAELKRHTDYLKVVIVDLFCINKGINEKLSNR